MKCDTNIKNINTECKDKPMIKPIENWVFKNGECYLNNVLFGKIINITKNKIQVLTPRDGLHVFEWSVI